MTALHSIVYESSIERSPDHYSQSEWAGPQTTVEPHHSPVEPNHSPLQPPYY